MLKPALGTPVVVAKHKEAWAVSGCRLTTIPDAYTLCEPWEVMLSLGT